MNIKIIKNLIIASAFLFVVLCAQSAHAYVPGVWDPTPRVNPNEPAFYVIPTTVDAPTPAPTQNRVTTTTTTTKAPVTVARAPVTRTRIVYVPAPAVATTTIQEPAYQYANSNNLPPAQTINPPVYNVAPVNTLPALTLQGSGGFMPSSIWQWFLVILLILAIIIIVRALSRAGEPTHETHTITPH